MTRTVADFGGEQREIDGGSIARFALCQHNAPMFDAGRVASFRLRGGDAPVRVGRPRQEQDQQES